MNKQKIKVMSLFSGIGAYERALKNIGIDFELVNYCELDKIKSKAYALLHQVPESLNLFDVTKIDTTQLKDFDLLVYSPPCQSFSIAGSRKGVNDIRGTLFYNALKVIAAKQPKYCIMENVDNLPANFDAEFNEMLSSLDKAGYNNYWKVINAEDFIPQNRKRVFVVSIRKDVDLGQFKFPIGTNTFCWYNFINPLEGRELTNRQKRMINYAKGLNKEDEIKLEGVVQFDRTVITLRQSGLRFQNNRVHPTITAMYGKGGGNFTILAYNGNVTGITPRQCFKLMGFEYEDSDLLTSHKFSQSAQYIMAGDSVCVPVLEEIFKKLLY